MAIEPLEQRLLDLCTTNDTISIKNFININNNAIDLSHTNNEALKIALNNFNYEIIALLLKDDLVLKCEHKNDYPATRHALTLKTKCAVSIITAVDKEFPESKTPYSLIVETLVVKQSGFIDAEKAPIKQRIGSTTLFSDFNRGIDFTSPFASAQEEEARAKSSRCLPFFRF